MEKPGRSQKTFFFPLFSGPVRRALYVVKNRLKWRTRLRLHLQRSSYQDRAASMARTRPVPVSTEPFRSSCPAIFIYRGITLHHGRRSRQPRLNDFLQSFARHPSSYDEPCRHPCKGWFRILGHPPIPTIDHLISPLTRSSRFSDTGSQGRNPWRARPPPPRAGPCD
jgi:hypothetical protein